MHEQGAAFLGVWSARPPTRVASLERGCGTFNARARVEERLAGRLVAYLDVDAASQRGPQNGWAVIRHSMHPKNLGRERESSIEGKQDPRTDPKTRR